MNKDAFSREEWEEMTDEDCSPKRTNEELAREWIAGVIQMARDTTAPNGVGDPPSDGDLLEYAMTHKFATRLRANDGEPAMSEFSDHQLACWLEQFGGPEITHSLKLRLDEIARRLGANDGERKFHTGKQIMEHYIEGCTIGSAFIRGNYARDSVVVELPVGGSLHEMLLQPCTLILHTFKESGE